MPTRGASTSSSSNSRLDLGVGHGLGGCALAHAAMSRRSWRPSKAITSAAAYAASRAAGTPSPSAVTLSTRPPAVTIAPSRSRGARVRDLDPGGHAVEPGDHVAAARRSAG